MNSKAEKTPPPIFVGGLFKSGTSLLRAMIGQHPGIVSGLETYWFDLDLDRGEGKSPHSDPVRLARFFDLAEEEVATMIKQSPDIYRFLDMFFSRVMQRSGKIRWAEKTPGNILHMDRILVGWPDAKIVHIIRDPRDVFSSLKQARKWDTVEEFMSRWCLFLGTTERHKTNLPLGPERYLEIRYESLVTAPRETMQTVMEFCGAPWHESVGRFEGCEEDFQKVRTITGKASTTLDRLRQPVATDRIGLWRTGLSPQETKDLEAAAKAAGLLEVWRKSLH